MANHKLPFLIIPIMLILALNSFAACTGSSPNWAATGAVADIASCYSSATSGDTITVTGNATWDSGLSITDTKNINLIGSGTPVITRGAAYTGALITVQPSSGNPTIRISGFRFEGGTNVGSDRFSINVQGPKNGDGGLTNIRIDNNYFNKGRRAVYLLYYVEALVDNNTFNNCDIAVAVTGDGNYSWNREIVPGTIHANFIEDNIFTGDEANRDVNLNQQIYHYHGGRSAIRYNIFDLSAITGSGGAYFIDSHGNNGADATPLDIRAQPLIECYNNIFKGGSAVSFGAWFLQIRGGSNLVYNNDFYSSSGTAFAITLWEEEAWTSGGPFTTKPYATAWPAEDQIFNSFFWNNRTFFNGTSTPTIISDIQLRDSATENEFIQKNRDYFMHAPDATSGAEILTDSGSPYYKVTNAMTLILGQQDYYGYTPYTYPHPLRVQKFTGNIMIGGAGLFN